MLALWLSTEALWCVDAPFAPRPAPYNRHLLAAVCTQGLEVSFGAFLAVILGLFIPVVFLVTLFIQSEAQGTATSFRQPDSIGGTRYEDE